MIEFIFYGSFSVPIDVYSISYKIHMGHMKLFNITQNDIETYMEFDLNFQFIN